MQLRVIDYYLPGFYKRIDRQIIENFAPDDVSDLS